MSTPLFNIGGIASGLDTQQILRDLMQLERQPVVRLEQRQAELREVDEAWGTITTRLSAVREALDGLRRTDSFQGYVSATSSQPDAVEATVAPGATPGGLTFSVEALATGHSVASDGTFTGADALVGAGELTITTADGVDHTVTTGGSTTLADLAAAIEASGAPVRAQVLETQPGEHRLVLQSTTTGADAAFDVSSDLVGLGDTDVLEQGADAHLKVGSLDVFRSGNTIGDLVDGVTLDLRQAGTGPVTVGVEQDVDAAVESVQDLVASVNDVLAEANTLSAYDTETQQAAVLQGDATLRGLVMDLRSAVSAAVEGLPVGANHGSAIGLSLGRDGSVELDESRLRQALEDDFDGVARLLSRAGEASDPRVAFAGAADDTEAGSYEVRISRAPRIAAVTGTGYFPPVGQPKTFTLTTSDGRTVNVQIDTDADTTQAAVSRIAAALSAEGISNVRVSADGDEVTFEHTRHGSEHGFEITSGGDLFGIADAEYTGEDVEGTIDGLPATGRGRTLTADGGAADGLLVTVSATQQDVVDAGGTLDLGTMDVTHGIGGALHEVLGRFEGAAGRIADTRASISSQIRRYDDQIADFEVRLAGREQTLRRQFTGLETAMSELQSQSAWMASQMGGAAMPM